MVAHTPEARCARLDAPEGVGLQVVSRAGLFRGELPRVLLFIKKLQGPGSGGFSPSVQIAGSAVHQLEA